MSVSGSLEDLSFPDILQIVHVSRQSGTLILSASGHDRRVRFRDGLVCGATLGADGPELEELLVRRGLVAAASLPPARARQELTGESLSSSLVSLGAVSQETIDRVVREELRSLLRALVMLQEGEFRFEPSDQTIRGVPGEIALQRGLKPDNIFQGMPARQPFLTRASGAAAHAVPRHILVVTERSSLARTLSDVLRDSGFDVVCCGSVTEGLRRAHSLVDRGITFVLVADLLVPNAAGNGWCGGLDLIQEIRSRIPDLVALAIGEVRDPSAAEQAAVAGATCYLTLPDLSRVGMADIGVHIREFCARVSATLSRIDRRTARPAVQEDGSFRAADPLSFLVGLIGEMNGTSESGIALLVLRLAAEYFERGVLFAVEGDVATPVGAFDPEGISSSTRHGTNRPTGVGLPLVGGSALERAVHEGRIVRGPIRADGPDRPLHEHLGAPAPTDSVLLPVKSGDEVVAVLYGDNSRSGAGIGDLSALEIFLNQAGIALQNSWLQRQLESLTERAAATPADGRAAR